MLQTFLHVLTGSQLQDVCSQADMRSLVNMQGTASMFSASVKPHKASIGLQSSKLLLVLERDSFVILA